MTDPSVGRSVCPGQRVALDACLGYDINNNERELYGEWTVDHVNPREVGLRPRIPDRDAHPDDQLVFVNLPLPASYHFFIEGVDESVGASAQLTPRGRSVCP